MKVRNEPLVLMAQRQEKENDWRHQKNEQPIILKRIEQGQLSIRCGKIYRRVEGVETLYHGPKGSNLQGLLVKFFEAGLIECNSKRRLQLTEAGRWVLSVVEAQELKFKRVIKELKAKK